MSFKLLQALWRKRARVLAGIIANGGREHREIAHAAALIRGDYHDRFLVELIQNAHDQALLGDPSVSTLVVVRSENLVAVSNGGQVVTPSNLERISSLADSDKTGQMVGNKGVGFKAVYQVTDAPEVYSAPEHDHNASVSDNIDLGFSLELKPPDNDAVRTFVENDLRTFFQENQGVAQKLREGSHRDPVAVVMDELKHVAGFKFPTQRTSEALRERLRVLKFPNELLRMARTLVVLPLRNDDEANRTTERALDALVGEGQNSHAQAELAVLFLLGIARIEVIDHVRDKNWSFSRRSTVNVDQPTVSAVVSLSDNTERVSQYWIVKKNVFDCKPDETQRRQEVVNQALNQFNLEAWKPDDPLLVTVALPQPRKSEPGPRGPSGRFCLGLPTEQSTGLPAHVDARFFAQINRKHVNFDMEDGYNALLLDVATEVFGELLACLRKSDSLAERRAATLALHQPEGAPGALAERVYAEGGIADGEVVLRWDGRPRA